jgi:hypothetical protein
MKKNFQTHYDEKSAYDVESIKMNYKAAKNRRLPFFIESEDNSYHRNNFICELYACNNKEV